MVQYTQLGFGGEYQSMKYKNNNQSYKYNLFLVWVCVAVSAFIALRQCGDQPAKGALKIHTCHSNME